MCFSKINKLRILLILPLVLLHLQFGITLLHNHHGNSCYDHKDPTHHICANSPTPTKWGVTISAPASPSYTPVLPATVTHLASPKQLTLEHTYPAPSRIIACKPTASFPNRASPAA